MQWHVVADGTVIEQRSRGEKLHDQLFQNYPTTRRLDIDDVVALQKRVDSANRSFNFVAWPLLALCYAMLLLAVIGFVLQFFDVDVSLWLFIGGIVGFIVARLLVGILTALNIGRWSRMWTEAGFESQQGVTMAAREAANLIAEPGTKSGPVTRKKRA